MVARGALSSWLTIARNSARRRPCSSTSAMSCMATTIDSTAPSSERMGVALSSTVTLSTVGDADDDLLGPHRLRGAHELGHRELPQGDLPPVGPLKVSTSRRSSGVWSGIPQAVDDPACLPVEGLRRSRQGVEDHHANGGGVHQRLQVGPGPPLLPVPAGVGDDQRGLGCEHHEGLLVLLGELPAALLMGQVDGADPDPQVANRGHHQGVHRQRGQEIGHVQCLQVAVDVRDPQRLLQPAEVLEEAQSLRHVPEPLVLLLGDTGDDERGAPEDFARDGDRPVARGRQRPGAVHHLLQHRVEVQALVDAEAGLAQARQAFPETCILPHQLV